MSEARKSKKLIRVKRNLSQWRHRPNTPEARRFKKPDACEEKSTMMKVQDQIYPKWLNNENSTHVKRYLSQWICRAKCTRNTQIKKTRTAWTKIHHDEGTRPNVLKAHKFRKSDSRKKTSTAMDVESKCTWGTWIKKIKCAWREIHHDKSTLPNVSDVCKSSQM